MREIVRCLFDLKNEKRKTGNVCLVDIISFFYVRIIANLITTLQYLFISERKFIPPHGTNQQQNPSKIPCGDFATFPNSDIILS